MIFAGKMEKKLTRYELLSDEVLMIENGGEIPEVTYHGSLHYLTEDPEGPGLLLSEEEILRLKLAVVAGYKKIITRDLMVENREKGLYRGLERCTANWNRVMGFGHRERLDLSEITECVCRDLKHFFCIEVNDVITLGKPTCVNCSTESLIVLFAAVGLDMADLPKEWKLLPKEHYQT